MVKTTPSKALIKRHTKEINQALKDLEKNLVKIKKAKSVLLGKLTKLENELDKE